MRNTFRDFFRDCCVVSTACGFTIWYQNTHVATDHAFVARFGMLVWIVSGIAWLCLDLP